MSSKHESSYRSLRSNYYPTSWSEWAWNEQYQCNVRYREVREGCLTPSMSKLVFLIYQTGEWDWEYADPPVTERETPYTPSVPYAPRAVSIFAKLPPADEDALAVEHVDKNYRHDEVISDLNRRVAETSIESQSELRQYSAGQHYLKYPAEHQHPPDQQYPAEQQYPEDNRNAEGEEYYQRHGDKWREKGSSEPQDYRRRDKKKGSSSKARDKNSGKNFAHSLELN
jgi:hypothetical protein